MSAPTLPPLTLKDIMIESVEPTSLGLNRSEYEPKDHNQQNKNEIAIKVTLRNIGPKMRKNFIYWIWGKKEKYLQYLNLLVFYLKGKNLNDYIQKRYLIPNVMWETQLSVLGDLWKEYVEKPDNIEFLNETTKMENYTTLNDFLLELRRCINEFNRELIRIRANPPPAHPHILPDNDPFLEKINIFYDNFEDLQTVYLHKKLFLDSIQKIVDTIHFQYIKKFLNNLITGNRPITIEVGGTFTYREGQTVRQITFTNQIIPYYQSLINLIFNIQKIYNYIIKNNKVDAIMAFVLHEYDISINQRNKKSFNYDLTNIPIKITHFLRFIDLNREFLSESLPGYVVSKFKPQKLNTTLIGNINQRRKNLTTPANILEKKFKKLKKYQRDIIERLSGTPIQTIPVQLEHHGIIEKKNINQHKRKHLMNYWNQGNNPLYMENSGSKNKSYKNL